MTVVDVVRFWITGSYIASVCRSGVAYLMTKTSRCIRLFFVVSTLQVTATVISGNAIYIPSIILRFLIVSCALLLFSQQPYWRAVRRNSRFCRFVKWLAGHYY